jgi:hypothetical protein
MWFNPAESGWGVNIILQREVAFMTFFVYDASQSPVWYTAELRPLGSAPFTWSGPLYATRGPWFGGAFPPAGVTVREAGTASFAVSTTDYREATLTYVVDGISVVKNLQRQTWMNENYTGTYAGGLSMRMSNCDPSSLDGVQEVVGNVGVIQTGTSISISLSSSAYSCALAGGYSQSGKLGRIVGTYSCTDGTQGRFSAHDLTRTVSGFNGLAAGQNQHCEWSGFVGGIRRSP